MSAWGTTWGQGRGRGLYAAVFIFIFISTKLSSSGAVGSVGSVGKRGTGKKLGGCWDRAGGDLLFFKELFFIIFNSFWIDTRLRSFCFLCFAFLDRGLLCIVFLFFLFLDLISFFGLFRSSADNTDRGWSGHQQHRRKPQPARMEWGWDGESRYYYG